MGKKKVAEQTTGEALQEQTKMDSQAIRASTASKKQKRIERARVYISASYNNTVISVTDGSGNVIAWATAGSLGFSGPKKATPFASSKVIAALAEKLKNVGIGSVEIFVKGVGGGRDSAMRSLVNQGFNIVSIKEVTPIPHNGPRPRKVRRV